MTLYKLIIKTKSIYLKTYSKGSRPQNYFWIGFQESHFHLSFYTATLKMMVKEMGTPYNLLFPSHEAPRLSAPIAVTSDAKWQDKSYQRDKIKLTQMLLIEMEWSQLLSSFPFIFSILSKNAAPRGTNRRSLSIQGQRFLFFYCKSRLLQ